MVKSAVADIVSPAVAAENPYGRLDEAIDVAAYIFYGCGLFFKSGFYFGRRGFGSGC